MGFLVAFVKDVSLVTGRTGLVGALGVGALYGLSSGLVELLIAHLAGHLHFSADRQLTVFTSVFNVKNRF
jgi:hypothetical protein